jgi:hypothetical protein
MMQSIAEVRALPGRGLEGDRYFAGTGYYSNTSSRGGREVTLIEIETIEALFRGMLNAAGERLGIKLAAADTRRNTATSGVPLNHRRPRILRRYGAHARHATLRAVQVLGGTHAAWRHERSDPPWRYAGSDLERRRHPRRDTVRPKTFSSTSTQL